MFFMWLHCLYIPIILVKSREFRSESVDYYEHLIKEGIKKSTAYTFPKDASAFKPHNQGNPVSFAQFDYIVIGGGSAGAVVASRLSEIPTWNVLLLEAGKKENDFTDIPSMSPYSLNSEYNWGFNSTPQSTCCLAMNGICPYPRGKALGGSTVINSLVYSRGNALDYDNWARRGNSGWSYDDVLHFFLKSENSNITGDSGYHGSGGYLNVEYHRPLSERAETYIDANREMGLVVGDYNGAAQLTAGPTQFTVRNGRRLSSAEAFLRPAYNRNNLRILTGSYVTKIVITGKYRKARGVIFSHHNVEYLARVRKEVILSAGVVGTPHILMLSGIGPAQHLREMGIPVQVNLNVGKMMHDHLTFYNMYFKTPNAEPFYALREAVEQYLRGVGPLTISTNPQSLSFHVLESTHSTVPDYEIVFVPSVKDVDLEVDNGIAKSNDDVFQIVLVLLHPKTRGSIVLRSKDPFTYPLIDSRCLDDYEDVAMVYKGIRLILELIDTNAFRELKPKLQEYPPCKGNTLDSKEYWLCVIRQTAMNAFHSGGTCRMGPNPSNGDVVDNELRVYGVTNLRIADASVVPVTLSAHMSAPAMMIGEKLADLIKHG